MALSRMCNETFIYLYNMDIIINIIFSIGFNFSYCSEKSFIKTMGYTTKKKSQVPGDFNWKLPWVIPDKIEPGDIIIFNIKTVHAASLNMSKPKTYRVSFDTRLQLIPNINYEENVKVKALTPIINKKKDKFQNAKQDIILASPHPGPYPSNNIDNYENAVINDSENDEFNDKKIDDNNVKEEKKQIKKQPSKKK